ncbi:peptide deformylase [Alphaproteobacteria bacterium 46_93_T64]|nr:peptide deformylase [Alphaproteobacteria bacterium 46_93_T64]
MTAKPILKMGNPLLRELAAPVDDPTTEEIRSLVEVMRLSMAEAGGVGLAAPQIGILLRVVIFSVPGDRLSQEDGGEGEGISETVLINPKIEILEEETALGWEGCLSVPGLRGLVPRFTKIQYSGQDLEGHLVQREAHGFHARVVQHEVDHLDGILYPERMTDLRNLVYETEMQAFMETYKVSD